MVGALVREHAPAVASRRRRIVRLVHGWPPFQQAGTELYAYWLARQQQAADEASVYLPAADPERPHREAVELLADGIPLRVGADKLPGPQPFPAQPLPHSPSEPDFRR